MIVRFLFAFALAALCSAGAVRAQSEIIVRMFDGSEAGQTCAVRGVGTCISVQGAFMGAEPVVLLRLSNNAGVATSEAIVLKVDPDNRAYSDFYVQVWLVDVNADGSPEVLVRRSEHHSPELRLFALLDTGEWSEVATFMAAYFAGLPPVGGVWVTQSGNSAGGLLPVEGAGCWTWTAGQTVSDPTFLADECPANDGENILGSRSLLQIFVSPMTPDWRTPPEISEPEN